MQPFNSQKWLPWKETVTVTSVRPNSTNVAANYPNAGVYRLGATEGAPSKGVYTKYEIKVTIGMNDGVTFDPKPFDTIQWKGDTYTVLSVDGSDWQQFWVLTCRNLVLAADLRATGTLSRPDNSQGATGRASLATYTPIASDIPCRVQPTDNTSADVLDRKTMPNTARVFLAQQVDARAKDQFVSGGVTYTVLASRNPDRMDELPYLDVEQVL